MKQLFIEIADTHEKRTHGLMRRKHMSKNHGMLFRFPYPEFHTFWMKDTYIPLDVAFIDDHGKILQIETMTPLSTRAVCANYRCRYALEVNRGWFSENNVSVGSKVDGEGIRSRKKISQATPQVAGAVPGVPEAIPEQPLPGEPAQPSEPQPEVMLNLSYKDRLEKANLKGQDMVLMYQTKGGITLPPKVISPPFQFEEDADGHHDSIVKAWDNQSGGWKSFLIDNILSLEEKK